MNLDHARLTNDLGDTDLEILAVVHEAHAAVPEMPLSRARFHARMARAFRLTQQERRDALVALALDLDSGDAQTGGMVGDVATEIERARAELRGESGEEDSV